MSVPSATLPLVSVFRTHWPLLSYDILSTLLLCVFTNVRVLVTIHTCECGGQSSTCAVVLEAMPISGFFVGGEEALFVFMAICSVFVHMPQPLWEVR